jgi:hypothetical protein
MAQWLSQKSDIVAKSYDLIVPGFTHDGATSDATLQAIIDLRVQTLGLPRPSSLDQMRDFAILREVERELRLQ